MSLIRISFRRYDRRLWSTSYNDGNFGAQMKIRGDTLGY